MANLRAPTRPHSLGFTLIELVLVLGVGALVTAGVYASFASREQDVKVRVTAQDMNDLVKAADRVYATSHEYRINGTPVSLPVLRASARTLPASFYDQGGSNFKNPWGGDWTIGTQSSDGTTGNLFRIYASGIPSYACARLVSATSPRAYSTRINNSLVALSPARTPASLGRSDPDMIQVTRLCSESEQNELVFLYLKPADYQSLRQQPMLETLMPGLETCTAPGCFQPTYDRTEAALNAREAAQQAL